MLTPDKYWRHHVWEDHQVAQRQHGTLNEAILIRISVLNAVKLFGAVVQGLSEFFLVIILIPITFPHLCSYSQTNGCGHPQPQKYYQSPGQWPPAPPGAGPRPERPPRPAQCVPGSQPGGPGRARFPDPSPAGENTSRR